MRLTCAVRKDEQINELYDFLIESEDVLHDAQKVFEEERLELDGIVEQLNLENKLMERTIRRMAATIVKLGGNLQQVNYLMALPGKVQLSSWRRCLILPKERMSFRNLALGP